MELSDSTCIVCGGPAAREWDVEEGRTYQSDTVCRRGCWEHHYSYGHTQERVGEQWWEWSYDSEESYDNEIREAIRILKEEQNHAHGS